MFKNFTPMNLISYLIAKSWLKLWGWWRMGYPKRLTAYILETWTKNKKHNFTVSSMLLVLWRTRFAPPNIWSFFEGETYFLNLYRQWDAKTTNKRPPSFRDTEECFTPYRNPRTEDAAEGKSYYGPCKLQAFGRAYVRNPEMWPRKARRSLPNK